MNPNWVPNGRSFTYPKEVKADVFTGKMMRKRDRWLGFRTPLYTLAREQEEENILLRRIKQDKAVLDIVLNQADKEELRLEEIMSDVKECD